MYWTAVLCVAAYWAIELVHGYSLSEFGYYQERGNYEIARYTINRGFEHYSMMWYPANATEDVQCFVFCQGTGALPEDYSKTAEHLASHGFAAIYVPMRPWDVTRGLEYCRSGEIVEDVPALQGWVNSAKMGVGGHSGGGPYAVHAASGVADVAAIVTQHGASIPATNQQSDETMAALPGDLMVLCGLDDSMPFCDCGTATEDYYLRAPKGRVLAEVPDGHVDGACLEKGEENEAGYLAAFLYYTLKGVPEAADALRQGKDGDFVTVELDWEKA